MKFFFSGANKNWIHSPETLLNGHVVYLVKVRIIVVIFMLEYFLCYLAVCSIKVNKKVGKFFGVLQTHKNIIF